MTLVLRTVRFPVDPHIATIQTGYKERSDVCRRRALGIEPISPALVHCSRKILEGIIVRFLMKPEIVYPFRYRKKFNISTVTAGQRKSWSG